jgi:glycosyltransferase involved in cell wall biosynthesis
MEKNKVSVVIPVYNATNYLERAVCSAIGQENVNEIILVEDGSKDNSLELCKFLKESSKIIHLMRHENGENKGPSASRNLGWKNAKNTWIQFLDADDELLPDKISHQLSLTGTHSNLVIGNSYNRFSDGRIYPRKFYNDPWVGLICGKLGITSANLFKRDILESVGGFNESLRTSEEYELMFKILKAGSKPVFDPEFLTVIHQSNDSICRSGNNDEILYQNWIELRKKIREFLIVTGRFKLKERYFYAGALGNFQKMNGKKLDDSINPLLLLFYNLQLFLKKTISK